MRSIYANVRVSCAALALAWASAAGAQMLVIGDDNKTNWNDAGKAQFGAPGKDEVVLVDLAKPDAPRIAATLPLTNSIAGPPTNVAITPDGKLALVANSLVHQEDGANWKPAPDTKLYVIDLEASPPAVVSTLDIGKQPSGMAINKSGTLALVANRADASVSVLTIKGKTVALAGSVPMGDPVAAVAISPDGKRALAAKNTVNKVALLEIDGDKATYNKVDMSVGVFPYNVQITADGRWGLVANQGNGGAADGGAGSVAVIDMTATPPRVVDYVAVGPAPEGLAVSPVAPLAIAIGLNGSAAVPKGAWFAQPHSTVDVLTTGANGVKRIAQLKAGRLAEGVAFSADGKHLYIGNYIDKNLQVFAVDGDRVTDTGKILALPGQPASLRANTP
jgi:DNA-binding beta-propeller fold protein YncE